MVRLLLCFLAMLVAPTPTTAQDVWYDEHGPAQPHPSRASRDGFGVMLMLTPDYDGFQRAWAGPTPPELTTTNEADRNEPVFGMVIFRGCRAGADGNCNVTAEFIILRPDGIPYGETLRGPIWDSTPAPASNLQLGIAAPGIRIESHDPRGTYVIHAVVTDQVAGITLQVQQELMVDSPATGDST